MKESGTYIMLYDDVYVQGLSISEVARLRGMSRNTVRAILKRGEQPHALKGTSKPSKLDPFKPMIESLMTDGIFNASLIFERIQEQGFRGGISIVKEWLAPKRPLVTKTTPAIRRYENKPGQQAQMDWGFMHYRNRQGKLHKVACFVMILSHSRMRYVEFSRRCDSASLLRCMVNAFDYFGGVPETVLTDRMKTVIQSVDHGKPNWNHAFERFAGEIGFVPKLCRVRRPQTKGKVERLVHFVRDNFMPGRLFINFGDLSKQALNWCAKKNAEVHGTTGEIPTDRLPQENLRPLPCSSVVTPYRWEYRKVARDAFVSFNGVRYGVHWTHVGQQLRVMQNGDQLLFVNEDGECVQEHLICHRSRAHVWAKGQYAGLTEQQGMPQTPAYGRQLTLEEVETRSLTVYSEWAEGM